LIDFNFLDAKYEEIFEKAERNGGSNRVFGVRKQRRQTANRRKPIERLGVRKQRRKGNRRKPIESRDCSFSDDVVVGSMQIVSEVIYIFHIYRKNWVC
jgi:hypothetical protein